MPDQEDRASRERAQPIDPFATEASNTLGNPPTSAPAGADPPTRDGGTVQSLESTREPIFALPDTRKVRDLAAGRGLRDGRDARDELRRKTRKQIRRTMTHNMTKILSAIPTAGKSFGSVQVAAELNVPVTILTPRKKLRKQIIEEWAPELDLEAVDLPSRDLCPTAAPDGREASAPHDEAADPVRNRVKDLLDRGAALTEIHERAERLFGEPLPCERDGECPYREAWAEIDPDEYDLIAGDPRHAHVPPVLAGRHVVFDEYPGDAFLVSFQGSEIDRIVNTKLAETDVGPQNLDELLGADQEEREALLDSLTDDDGGLHPDPGAPLRSDNSAAHAHASALVYLLVAAGDAEPRGDSEWRHVDLPGSYGAAAYHPGAEDALRSVEIVYPPEGLDAAESLLGLDGEPALYHDKGNPHSLRPDPFMWRIALNLDDLQYRQTMSADERRAYREQMGFRVVQVTDHERPISSGEYAPTEEATVLGRYLERKHDRQPVLITSWRALRKHEDDAADPTTDGGLSWAKPVDVGGEQRPALTYGQTRGHNTMAQERLAIVEGVPHWGDGYVEKWCALADEPYSRNGKGMDREYGPFGEAVREFFQEKALSQAMHRLNRDGNGAVIYALTARVPDDWPVIECPDIIRVTSPGTREVLRAIGGRESWTVGEIADDPSVSVGRRQVRHILTSLTRRGFLRRQRAGRGYEYHGCGPDDPIGWVDLPRGLFGRLRGLVHGYDTYEDLYTFRFRVSPDLRMPRPLVTGDPLSCPGTVTPPQPMDRGHDPPKRPPPSQRAHP